MKVVAVIPARYGSSRFVGKPLAEICGRPMIWWTYQSVAKARKIGEIYVATDDRRIADVCKQYDMNFVMTSADANTSTERLHEVSLKIPADVYVCVNGDEPLIKPDVIDAIVPNSLEPGKPYVANIMAKMKKPADVVDFTNIKVVTSPDGYALFMSRSPIPFPKGSLNYDYFKHVGVLAYNREALNFFSQTKRGQVETIEDINELRFIENGVPLKMIETFETESLSVDTPKDLEKVIEAIKAAGPIKRP